MHPTDDGWGRGNTLLYWLMNQHDAHRVMVPVEGELQMMEFQRTFDSCRLIDSDDAMTRAMALVTVAELAHEMAALL